MPQHLFLEKLPKFNYIKKNQWCKSNCVQNFERIMRRRMYRGANVRDLQKRENKSSNRFLQFLNIRFRILSIALSNSSKYLPFFFTTTLLSLNVTNIGSSIRFLKTFRHLLAFILSMI